MPSAEALHEIRLWFDSQPVMAQALISISVIGGMLVLLIRYLRVRDTIDKEARVAVAEQHAKTIEGLQENQRWMVEVHVEQVKDLVKQLKDSLAELSASINRNQNDQFRDLRHSVDRSSEAAERIAAEIRRYTGNMLS